MKKILLILTLLVFSQLPALANQSAIVKNHVFFSEGSVIQDDQHYLIGEDIADSIPYTGTGGYWEYIVTDRGYDEPGTVNIIVGTGRYFRAGTYYHDGVDYDSSDISEIYDKKIEGLPDLDDHDGDEDGNENGYEELQISTDILSRSIWLYYDARMLLEAYSGLDLSLEKTNPTPIRLNAEYNTTAGKGADINVADGTMILQHSPSKVEVGINTTPDLDNGGLHVNGTVELTGEITGRVGEIITSYNDTLSVAVDSTEEIATITVYTYPNNSDFAGNLGDLDLKGIVVCSALITVSGLPGGTNARTAGENTKYMMRLAIERYADSSFTTLEDTNYSQYVGFEFTSGNNFLTMSTFRRQSLVIGKYYKMYLEVRNASYGQTFPSTDEDGGTPSQAGNAMEFDYTVSDINVMGYFMPVDG